MDMAINLESVELGSTENHLLFTGYVPSLDNFRKYKFDYPPFDEENAKEKLGNLIQYRITM